MSKVIKIKRGLDIKLKGSAEKVIVDAGQSGFYAVKPPDFLGITPKLLVKPGREVKTGTPLFYDKHQPSVLFVSPVTGTVSAVNRGARRRILEVVVQVADSQVYEPLRKADPRGLSSEEITEQILHAGLWPAIIQRPYGIIAEPGTRPRSVFISGFDSVPLGPDYELILRDEKDSFAAGIEALKKLTDGSVHLGLPAGATASKVYDRLEGVSVHYFTGPHPAGNVGIQIHHVAPINKGEVVWTVSPQHVALIGRTFLLGHLDPTWIVAVAGSMISRPRYFRTLMGTGVQPLLHKNLREGEVSPRVISGNVLTGTSVGTEGYLGFYDSLLSVIPEGDHYELFGWAMPGLKKFSASRAFFSYLQPRREWDLDTNLHGGQRAFVLSGQYEKVLPMDILPVQLLKSILAEDIDKMEQLGIYEVVEEDMALCEFVCTSKIEVQEILRQGLDILRKEMS